MAFSVLKNITRTVQIFPFIYSALYIGIFVLYNFGQDSLLDILDALFYISPIVVFAHIVYSYILKLCTWHRIACAIPLIAEAVNVIDTYFYEFSEQDIIILHSITLFIIVIYIISAYKVFFCNGSKQQAGGGRENT